MEARVSNFSWRLEEHVRACRASCVCWLKCVSAARCGGLSAAMPPVFSISSNQTCSWWLEELVQVYRAGYMRGLWFFVARYVMEGRHTEVIFYNFSPIIFFMSSVPGSQKNVSLCVGQDMSIRYECFFLHHLAEALLKHFSSRYIFFPTRGRFFFTWMTEAICIMLGMWAVNFPLPTAL